MARSEVVESSLDHTRLAKATNALNRNWQHINASARQSRPGISHALTVIADNSASDLARN